MSARTNATDLILFTYTGQTELGAVRVQVQAFVAPNGDLALDTNCPDALNLETVRQAIRRSRTAMHRDVTATCPPRHRIKEY
jgi:hypothetical protein